MFDDSQSPRLQYGGVIGAGGMGTVMEARQLHLGRTVAVKRLHPERANAANAQALLAEARVTGMVAHPGVVPIHQLGIGDEGQAEIVLKRIDGKPWSQLIRDPNLVRNQHDTSDVLAFHIGVLGRVCEAVHAAHKKQILHRDLKPGNIMVGRLGEVYVLDWGLAVCLDPDADPRLPKPTKNAGGTPQYMAPEMVSDRYGALGPWTDVYLLGGLLFCILNGRPPHPGATSWNMVIDACKRGVVVPDSGPAELVALCRRCLERKPEDRIQDAQSLGRALQTWLDHRPSVALVERGEYNLELLELALTSGSEDPDGAEAALVQARFGAAVFAFQRAIDLWPTNQPAVDGLHRSVRKMAEHALADGRGSQAQVALSYLPKPPRDLARRARRQARLQRLGLSNAAATWGVALAIGVLLASLAWLLVGPVAFALLPAPGLLAWVASRANRIARTADIPAF